MPSSIFLDFQLPEIAGSRHVDAELQARRAGVENNEVAVRAPFRLPSSVTPLIANI